jgi:hypothetical protein
LQFDVHTPGTIVAKVSFTLDTAAGDHETCT